jgi:hypothetical protein
MATPLSRTQSVPITRTEGITIALLGLSSVIAYSAAQYQQGLWLLFAVPFALAMWTGLVFRPTLAAVMGGAYALSLIPSLMLCYEQLHGATVLGRMANAGFVLGAVGLPGALALLLTATLISVARHRQPQA